MEDYVFLLEYIITLWLHQGVRLSQNIFEINFLEEFLIEIAFDNETTKFSFL